MYVSHFQKRPYTTGSSTRVVLDIRRGLKRTWQFFMKSSLLYLNYLNVVVLVVVVVVVISFVYLQKQIAIVDHVGHTISCW